MDDMVFAEADSMWCGRIPDVQKKYAAISDWARSRVGDWTHQVELPAERIDVAAYRPDAPSAEGL